MAGSRRILIAGVSSALGSALAAALEAEPGLEAIIGVDRGQPRQELARTEFVHLAERGALVGEIAQAAGIDTVVDVRQGAGGAGNRGREPVEDWEPARGLRKLVLASSDLVYGVHPGQPAFIDEDQALSGPGAGAAADGARAAERAAAALAQRRGGQLCVTVARLAPIVGLPAGCARTRLLALPVIPAVLGSDPRWPLVHADDAVGALVHAAMNELPGSYNVAADGVLALSEIATLLGRPLAPLLFPWGTLAAVAALRRLGLPVSRALVAELRFGHGLDNRRLKAAGFRYRYTAREALIAVRDGRRDRRALTIGGEPDRRGGAPRRAGSADGYDDLSPGELAAVIPSLEQDGLKLLRDHELSRGARTAVLELLEEELARRSS